MSLKRGNLGGDAQQEQLEGAVERVTFHSEESGFSVLKVKVRGHQDLQTVVGKTPAVVPGEWIKARGTWIDDRDHGRQFKSDSLETTPPNSRDGIERFLGSGLVKGIGPVYAKKLVDKFGEEIFDVIDHRSALLEKVEGIGTKRRQIIKNSWQEARHVRAIMSFLMQHNVSTTRAFRIYKTYGHEAIQLLEADPYRLARDVRGIGFTSADKIARSMGIAADSDLRARAGVEHALAESTHHGHCAYSYDDLVARTTQLLGIDDTTIVARAIDYSLLEARIAEETDPELGRLLYLMPLHTAEVQLAAHLKQLDHGPHPSPNFDPQRAIAWVQQQIGFELAPAQHQAVAAACSAKVMIITGGPGVGKTTILNAIIHIFDAKNMRLALCAPTGRAAKRMTEATGREAKTIHRMLQFEPASGHFKHNATQPLEADIFVVDEASMLDLTLAWNLVNAIPPQAALLLVGDVQQLPSVGPGMVLHDLIACGRFSVAQLNTVFRQAAESAIVSNAHRIQQGEFLEFGSIETPSDCYLIEAEDADHAAQQVARMVGSALPERFGLDPLHDIQVLTPMQRGILGARNLNTLLQQHLNPHQEAIEQFGFRYATGDKVMQISNNYDREVYNGDIGRITRLDPDERELTVTFGPRTTTYDINELDELVPAYAITIHKSQGSEYPCVVIPMHPQHYLMLQRNLLYTAITRGKRLVVLVGTKQALFMAIRNKDANKRLTTLARRLHLGA